MGFLSKLTDFFYYSAEEEAAKVPSDWRKRRRWNSVPVYPADEALLILAKTVLADVRGMADNAAQYSPGSVIQRHTGYYVDVSMAMLRSVMAGFDRLSDTPLGDKALMDALELVREQYEAVREEIGGTP